MSAVGTACEGKPAASAAADENKIPTQMPSERRNKLLQIKLGGLAQIADGLRHRLALSRGARFGIEGDKTALFGWNQNGGEMHGRNLRAWKPESSPPATPIHEPPRPECNGRMFAREEEKRKRKKVAQLHNLAEALNYPLTPKPSAP